MSEGWAQPLNSKKFHFFREGRSLCGKWAFLSEDLDDDNEEVDSPDDCRECLRRRKAIRTGGA